MYDYLLNKDAKIGDAFSNYFAKILSISIEKNIEEEISVKLINYFLDKIPVEISKNWSEMEYFNNFILILIENSEKIKKKFLSEEILSKLIDFILGKESPLYKGDDRNENKNVKGKFGPLIMSIALLFEYYINNKEKDKNLKLSENDEIMINHLPFYEKLILNDYDEKSTSDLINLKINSFNINESLNENYLDLLIKIKIPSSKNIEGIQSSLNLIDKLLSNIKDENKKKQLIAIIFGVPSIIEENEETKICYFSGRYFNYYSILTYIVNYIKINDEKIILLLSSIFKLLLNHNDVYEYLQKLPAPNSYTYNYIEFLLKLYIEVKEKIIKNELKYGSKVLEDIYLFMDLFYQKYNIKIENIKNDIRICIRNYMNIYSIKYQLLENYKNIDSTILKTIINYKEKIKIFYIKFYYYLTQDFNKVYFKFFIEKNKDIPTQTCIDTDKETCLSNSNLNKYCLEGLFIQGNKNCDLSFSLEPYIPSNMEIKIKKYEKYTLFIKDYNLVNDDKIKEDKDNFFIDFDLTKLEIKDLEKENKNEIIDDSNSNILQNNDDIFIINCPACNTPNVIDENNQTFLCSFCSNPLL